MLYIWGKYFTDLYFQYLNPLMFLLQQQAIILNFLPEKQSDDKI